MNKKRILKELHGWLDTNSKPGDILELRATVKRRNESFIYDIKVTYTE